ncbi:uncharacterized protein LOC128318173 [Pangasianodon hypophthalmus]|uniref:uncharacterized protein LOC128318173 n=1 Tax=Pangasianodon hypophthalmus TaxID=310915 RepID=UPI002307EF95|nr:uncharacterized protein LOC128318173 [Pangasianodon hypophthalmus]
MQAAQHPESGMDAFFQQFLQMSLQHQANTEELARGLQTTTRDLLELKKMASSAAAVPRPDPCREAQLLLIKLTPDEDVEAFLLTFKRVAQRENWPREDWAPALAPLLMGVAQRACPALTLEEAACYETLKSDILLRCGLSPTSTAAEHHRWTYNLKATPRSQMDTLLCITKRWLQPELLTAVKVAERVAMDWFLRALPPEERKAVRIRGAKNPKEMTEVLEQHRNTEIPLTVGLCRCCWAVTGQGSQQPGQPGRRGRRRSGRRGPGFSWPAAQDSAGQTPPLTLCLLCLPGLLRRAISAGSRRRTCTWLTHIPCQVTCQVIWGGSQLQKDTGKWPSARRPIRRRPSLPPEATGSTGFSPLACMGRWSPFRV